jgi:hypothetical protein
VSKEEIVSDLVNRLRGQYQVGPNGVYGTRSFADFIPPISLEAADKIEELEQEVQRLRDAVINAYECGHNDTVESNYCDPEERAQEIIDEAIAQNKEL